MTLALAAGTGRIYKYTCPNLPPVKQLFLYVASAGIGVGN